MASGRQLPAVGTHLPTKPVVRRGVRLTALLVVAVALSLGGVWVGATAVDFGSASITSVGPAPPVTVFVERRHLFDTVVLNGEVSVPEIRIDAPAPVDGNDLVVTNRPVSVGSEVTEGDIVIYVADRPVFLLEGSAPMFRTIRPSDTGSDVTILQGALRRIGLAIDDADGLYGPSTQAAVTELYRRADLEPLRADQVDAVELESQLSSAKLSEETARLGLESAKIAATAAKIEADASVDNAARSLATIEASYALRIQRAEEVVAEAEAYAEAVNSDPDASPETVAVAEAAVADAELALGLSRIEASDAIDAASEAEDLAREQRALAYASADQSVEGATDALDQAMIERESAEGRVAAETALTGAIVPRGEFAFLPALPAIVTQVPDHAAIQEGEPLVVLGLGKPELRVPMSESQADHVALLASDSPMVSFEAVIANQSWPIELISIRPTEDSGSDGAEQLVGLFALDMPDRQPVTDELARVTVSARLTTAPSLVVPLSAVWAGSNSEDQLTVVRPGGVSEDVAIRIVEEAGGWAVVETINGGRIEEGDEVVVGTS